ncbi:MAG: hypothetical protein KJ587_13200 [Alphaproteobacteria bacterium]|nr:hypothetical protein [Alphaproteobacteria bacterium]
MRRTTAHGLLTVIITIIAAGSGTAMAQSGGGLGTGAGSPKSNALINDGTRRGQIGAYPPGSPASPNVPDIGAYPPGSRASPDVPDIGAYPPGSSAHPDTSRPTVPPETGNGTIGSGEAAGRGTSLSLQRPSVADCASGYSPTMRWSRSAFRAHCD